MYQREFSLDEIQVIFEYSDIADVIKKWKYTEKIDIPEQILSEYRKIVSNFSFSESNIQVMSIPIGLDRFFERKFNQSNILTKQVSKALHIPVFPYIFRFWS